MTTEVIQQATFSLGEVDVVNWKRTDLKAYLSAAQALTNMEIGTTQLAKKRRGTRNAFIDTGDPSDVTIYAQDESQMYEFIDINQQYYLIMSATAATGWTVFLVDPTDGSLTFYQTVAGSPPYTTPQLLHIDYALDSDSLVLTTAGVAPGRIFVSSYGPAVFTWQTLVVDTLNGPIFPLPSFDFQKVNYANFTVVFTNPTPTTFRIVMTEDGAHPGEAAKFTTAWIGGEIASFGATEPRPLGYGIITNVTHPGATTVQFDGVVYVPFAAPADMPLIGSQYSIKQPAWSATLGWPEAVAFYQNRLWFANTMQQPTTIYGSKINQPVNFDVGVAGDADAIIYNIGQTGTGDILWLNGGKQLEIYTENYEFACPQDQAIGLTPGTFSVRQQSSFGASALMKPITYMNDSYFATKGGGSIVNFHFDGVGLAYTSSNISIASQHLIGNPINRALQRSQTSAQDNFIYFVNSPSLTEVAPVATFQFQSEVKLAAFTPITWVDEVQTIDIVSVNNRVYFLKKYLTSGNYFIEVFDDNFREDLVESHNAIVFIAGQRGVVLGLGDYEGYSVRFFLQQVIDGKIARQDFGESLDVLGAPAPVSGGVAYFENFNDYFGQIYVGFSYPVLLRPMYIFAGATKSNDFKNIKQIFVDYFESINFSINGYDVPYQSFTQIQANFPYLVPITDTAIVQAVDGWGRYTTFDIVQDSPFDLQITAIRYQIDSQII